MIKLIMKNDIGGKHSEEIDVDNNDIQTGTIFECFETQQRLIYCNAGVNRASLILWGLGVIEPIKSGTVLKEYKR